MTMEEIIEARDQANALADIHDMQLADQEGYVECPGCGTWVRDRGIDILYHVMKEVHSGEVV